MRVDPRRLVLALLLLAGAAGVVALLTLDSQGQEPDPPANQEPLAGTTTEPPADPPASRTSMPNQANRGATGTGLVARVRASHARTRAPVVGARLDVRGDRGSQTTSATTNAQGEATIALPIGSSRWELRAKHNRLVALRSPIVLDQPDQDLEIKFTDVLQITGTVLKADDTPCASAGVWLAVPRGQRSLESGERGPVPFTNVPPRLLAEADSEGKFQIEARESMPPDAVLIACGCDQIPAALQLADVKLESGPVELTLRMTEGVGFAGMVFDEANQPVPGCRLRLIESKSRVFPGEVTPNTDNIKMAQARGLRAAEIIVTPQGRFAVTNWPKDQPMRVEVVASESAQWQVRGTNFGRVEGDSAVVLPTPPAGDLMLTVTREARLKISLRGRVIGLPAGQRGATTVKLVDARARSAPGGVARAPGNPMRVKWEGDQYEARGSVPSKVTEVLAVVMHNTNVVVEYGPVQVTNNLELTLPDGTVRR